MKKEKVPLDVNDGKKIHENVGEDSLTEEDNIETEKVKENASSNVQEKRETRANDETRSTNMDGESDGKSELQVRNMSEETFSGGKNEEVVSGQAVSDKKSTVQQNECKECVVSAAKDSVEVGSKEESLDELLVKSERDIKEVNHEAVAHDASTRCSNDESGRSDHQNSNNVRRKNEVNLTKVDELQGKRNMNGPELVLGNLLQDIEESQSFLDEQLDEIEKHVEGKCCCKFL